MKWLYISVIVVVFSLIMVPIEKWVYRRISKRWLAYATTFAIAIVILYGLHTISALCGYSIGGE